MLRFFRDSMEISSVYTDHGTPCTDLRGVTYGMDVSIVSKTAQIYGSYGILVRRTISQRILHSSKNNIPSKQLQNSILRHNEEFAILCKLYYAAVWPQNETARV